MSEIQRHIILIGSAYPLRGGGIATFNERLARALTDHGDHVIIHSFSLQYPKIFFPGTNQYTKEPPPEGLNIEVSVNSINPFNWIITGRKLRHARPDIVLIRFWIPFMAPALGTLARIIRGNGYSKVVAIVDNITPHETKTGLKLLTRYFTGSVEGFIVMSKAVLNELDAFDKSKPRVLCPHPLYDNFGDIIPKEEAKRVLNLDVNARYVLFFGFIRAYKGLDILLHAFTDERLKNLKIKLLVAGEFYSDEAVYRDIIEKNQLSENVVIRSNFIPNSEVRNYFCACDVVAQPYKTATQSGVTQVAYHFNKPMITTNVGGLPEMVPDGLVGYVVQPDTLSVADAIYAFFNGNKEVEFSENVKKEKKKFSWENMVHAIDELAQQIDKQKN
jgi:glycosyltransferase involved in cell wall biosynthesis